MKNVPTFGIFAGLIALFAFAANDWTLPGVGPKRGPDWCASHEKPLATCEKCNPRLARGGTFVVRDREPKEGECPNTLVRITLGADVARQAGLELQSAELLSVAETIRANAEVRYPPDKYARVAPRISGIVREVKAILGQPVDIGSVLAILESPEFGHAKAGFLQARAVLALKQQVFDSERDLFEKKISSGREFQTVRTALEEAKLEVKRADQKLTALGMSPEQIQAISERDASSMMDVVAPFSGLVVEAAAVPGEMATPEKAIFAVANVERLWLWIDLYEADLVKVEKDQKVAFVVEGLPGRRFPGKVVTVGAEVDDRTRTLRAYAEIKNNGGMLKANMFGRAEITVKPAEPKLLVPKSAVQNDGDCSLVFVSPTQNIFQARKIQLGAAYENGYEVTGGLASGEKVVTTGSFLLKTEVLRGQIGAG